MARKKNNSKRGEHRLGLPLGNIKDSEKCETDKSNIISFSSKLTDNINKKRKASINRLLSYAEKLKW